MDLPVAPPVAPMLAKAVPSLPEAPVGEFLFEPKWDGFRGIIFKDGDQIELGSRNERPLTRYFPELVDALRAELPERCVLDGEIVIVSPHGLDFDALLQRIHPADSRVRMLAEATPASFVAFDVLALGGDDLTGEPFVTRRLRLEQALAHVRPPVHLTPITTDRAVAADWFDRFEGAGLDGVMAKPADGTYRQNERTMMKVKPKRTADCVVAGFRMHKSGDGVGSLLIGLYDNGEASADQQPALHHVGVATSFTAARRKELLDELAPYRIDDLSGHPWEAWAQAEAEAATTSSQRQPGATSRWNAGKDLSWIPLRADLVAEVAYEHMQGRPGTPLRFRHATRLVRWRPDRDPSSCTYDQLEVTPAMELSEVFGA